MCARCGRRANIKVSSTETGAIFGNIVYESTGYAERSVVVLSDIHIDIMDYISPASCPDVQFRSMWAEFEWENKARAHVCLCLLPWLFSFLPVFLLLFSRGVPCHGFQMSQCLSHQRPSLSSVACATEAPCDSFPDKLRPNSCALGMQ